MLVYPEIPRIMKEMMSGELHLRTFGARMQEKASPSPFGLLP